MSKAYYSRDREGLALAFRDISRMTGAAWVGERLFGRLGRELKDLRETLPMSPEAR